jgi:hypothetical protein
MAACAWVVGFGYWAEWALCASPVSSAGVWAHSACLAAFLNSSGPFGYRAIRGVLGNLNASEPHWLPGFWGSAVLSACFCCWAQTLAFIRMAVV